LFDVFRAGEELVIGLFEFAVEQLVEVFLKVGIFGAVDEVPELVRVFEVVVEQPWAGEVADIGVTAGPDATVLAAASGAFPLAERGGTGDEGGVVRFGAGAGEDGQETCAFNGGGDLDTTKVQEGGQDIRCVDGGVDGSGLVAKTGGITQQERDADGLVPGLLLFLVAVGVKHIAVVGGENKDGVVLEAELVKGLEESADAVVECGDVRVVAGQGVPCVGVVFGWNIGAKVDGGRVEEGLVFFGSGVVRGVGWSPGKEQQKGSVLWVGAEVGAGLFGLGDGVVTGPLAGAGVVVGEVIGVVVVMGATDGPEELEALASLGRDIGTALLAVEVPFSDVGGVVAGLSVEPGDGKSVVTEWDIVEEDTVGEGVLSGQEACTIGAADGAAGYSIGEVDGTAREAVEVRGADVGVCGIAECLCPPLISKDEQHIRSARRAVGSGSAGGRQCEGRPAGQDSSRDNSGAKKLSATATSGMIDLSVLFSHKRVWLQY